MTGRRRGWALAALGVFLISTDSLFIRWSEVDSWTVAFWVALFSLMLYSGVGLASGGGNPVVAFRSHAVPMMVVAVFSAASQIFFISAITRTAIANVAVIVAAAPVAATLLAMVVLGERARRRVWWAIAITIIGVLVIVSRSVGSPTLHGDLLAVGAVVAFAFNMTVWRRYGEMSRLLGLSLAAVLIAIVSAAAGASFALDARAWLALAAMGLAFNPVGRLCYTVAPRHAPASEVAMFAPVETVAAPLWAWLAFAEVPANTTVVGGVIVLAGMLYATLDPDVR